MFLICLSRAASVRYNHWGQVDAHYFSLRIFCIWPSIDVGKDQEIDWVLTYISTDTVKASMFVQRIFYWSVLDNLPKQQKHN